MTDKPRVRVMSNGQPYFHDGLQNLIANIGNNRDKRTHNQFVYSSFYNWQQLEAAYQDSWLARQVVDVPVEDATREWRTFSNPDAELIADEEKRLRLQSTVQEAFKWSGLYGGAIILMITDQALDKPLDVKRIGLGGLKRFIVIDRFYMSGFDYNYTNPISENFMLPEYYTIYGGYQQIHHTHVIRVPGAKLPLRLRMVNGGWDDSQLRKCIEDVKDALAAKGGIASLIMEANVDVIKREGLSTELASGEEDKIAERFRLGAQLKSINNMLLLDGAEEYQRHSISFGGLGDVLSTLMEWVSGAAEIPMTRLFGVQSKGIGDSGQGDMNNYYNAIRGKQESDYRYVMDKVDQVLLRSALGHLPDDCKFDWNPLSTPSGTEQAQQELADAQSDDLRLAQGVIKPSHIALKMKERGIYPITDADVSDLQKIEKVKYEDDSHDPFAKVDGDNKEDNRAET